MCKHTEDCDEYDIAPSEVSKLIDLYRWSERFSDPTTTFDNWTDGRRIHRTLKRVFLRLTRWARRPGCQCDTCRATTTALGEILRAGPG